MSEECMSGDRGGTWRSNQIYNNAFFARAAALAAAAAALLGQWSVRCILSNAVARPPVPSRTTDRSRMRARVYHCKLVSSYKNNQFWSFVVLRGYVGAWRAHYHHYHRG